MLVASIHFLTHPKMENKVWWVMKKEKQTEWVEGIGKGERKQMGCERL